MENENSYYTQPENGKTTENQNMDATNQQTYGQPEQQTYGQPNQQTYGQPNQQTYGQACSQPNQQAYGQAYGQPNQQTYGQNMGYGTTPVGPNGQPVKNNSAMKFTFSILEILTCCVGNVVALVMGILGCVFTSKANAAYKQGNAQEYKSQSKKASIFLWIGLGFLVVEIIVAIIVSALDLGPTNVGHADSNGLYVVVDGQTINIPTDYKTLEDQGFSLDAYDAGETVDGNGDFGFYQLMNKDGDYVMWCWFYNGSSSEKPLEECDIIGIDVDYNCDNYASYETKEGLGFFDSADAFVDEYGTPDDFSRDGDDEKYVWYLDNGSDPVWRVMEVTFRDGVLYDIDVDFAE